MTKLHDLYHEQGQSPWLDNLSRGWHHRAASCAAGSTRHPRRHVQPDDLPEGDGRLGRLRRPVRRARRARRARSRTPTGRWSIADIEAALRILRPVYDESGGVDGFVSVEVAPDLARDTDGHHRDGPRRSTSASTEPNLYVKIPATAEGVPAIRR